NKVTRHDGQAGGFRNVPPVLARRDVRRDGPVTGATRSGRPTFAREFAGNRPSVESQGRRRIAATYNRIRAGTVVSVGDDKSRHCLPPVFRLAPVPAPVPVAADGLVEFFAHAEHPEVGPLQT